MTEKGKHNPLLAVLTVLVACCFVVTCTINYLSNVPEYSGGKVTSFSYVVEYRVNGAAAQELVTNNSNEYVRPLPYNTRVIK